MQVFDNFMGHTAHGAMTNTGENRITYFIKQGAAKTQQAVNKQKKHWQGEGGMF